MKNKKWIIAGLVFIAGFHLWLLLNLRYEAWPEMLLIPYLQLKGFHLYSEMVYHYNPGLAWIGKFWFGVFGTTPEALKSLTWGIILINDLLVALISWKKWGKRAAIAALCFMALIQPLFDGNGLWYELAMIPWLLLAFWSQNPIFLAASFVVKQSTFWFFPTMIKQWKKLLILLLVTFAGLSFWTWTTNSLLDFWFWAYKFIFTIFPNAQGYKDFATWRHWALPFWVSASVIGWNLWRRRSLKFLIDPKDPSTWAMLSMPLMLPRFGLFHFQPAVAFLALAFGKLVAEMKVSLRTLALLAILAVPLGIFWNRVTSTQWQHIDRFLEPEIYRAAKQVSSQTEQDKPVFLLGGPEQVYVLSNRVPPKPWLTQFSWFLELPGFQTHLVESFKQQELKQIYITPYLNEGEFALGSYRPKELLNFAEEQGAKELIIK